MAQKVMVEVTDDLDGSTGASTVRFGLDGYAYEIDLSEPNADALREVFGPYVANARRMGGRKVRGTGSTATSSTRASSNGTHRRASSGAAVPVFSSASDGRTTAQVAASRERSQAIREWCRQNGITISDRGRIPNAIIEQYEAAQQEDTASRSKPNGRGKRK